MPPRKEVCRNFARGSCQYGDRCKFLHVSPQQSKPNPFGFGMQAGQQHQNTNFQQHMPNPSGFNVQNNFQSRAASEFDSKQNQQKPFENKWSRTSSSNTNGAAKRQPDNQPSASVHQCTDPESCRRQISEDFEHERPLWKLTCYGHSKNGPCDIVGDTSYEELRASAYDDAKRGLSLQSLVERERSLVNSKLREFDSLVHNPYKGSSNSAFGSTNPAVGMAQTASVAAQSTNPPSFSSFSQLGTSLNTGASVAPNNLFGQSNPFQNNSRASAAPNNLFGQSNPFQNNSRASAAPNNLFGQSNPFQNNSQKSTVFQMNNLQTQNSGFGSQPHQTLQSPYTSGFTGFNNSSTSSVQNQVSPSPFLSQIPGSNNGQSSIQNVNIGQHGVGLPAAIGSSAPSERTNGDDSIWLKEDWNSGEIPEEAPPEKFCT